MTKLPRRPGKGQIRSQGKIVWSVEWDWGGPGEAGADEVYQLDGAYYYIAEDGELYGPYANLAETVQETGLNTVSRATRTVNSPVFAAPEVAALLIPLEDNMEFCLVVSINGEKWVWVQGVGFREFGRKS